MPAAVALAVEQLGRIETGRKELYLVSDFQRTNRAEVQLEAVPGTTKVIFMGTEEGERENLASTGIKLRPAVPRAAQWEQVEKAGLYTIMADGREAAVVAVNIHPDETDLRTIDSRELQSEGERAPTYLVDTSGKDTPLEDLTKNRPLWPYLLLAAFGALVMEQLVAGLSARRTRNDSRGAC